MRITQGFNRVRGYCAMKYNLGIYRGFIEVTCYRAKIFNEVVTLHSLDRDALGYFQWTVYGCRTRGWTATHRVI